MNLSTKMKAAVGYAAVIALFLAAVWLIVGVLDSLTRSDGAERTINNRQRATNDVVSQLYQAEVIGQALSAGQTDLFQSYVDAMMLTAQAVDSLRAIVNDRAQVARLDSVKMLLGRKVDNMDNLLDAMEADNSDELYQQYISDLIANQNREIAAPKVQHSQTVRTSEYVVHKKRKNFFGRLRDAFSKEDNNPQHVSETVTEHHTDTLANTINPADTVVKMLSGVRKRVDGHRIGQIAQLKRQTAELRINGQMLSRKVSELLAVIVDESSRTAETKHLQAESVRRHAAREIAAIAFAAVVLAMAFLFMIWRDITRSNHYRHELGKAKKRAEDLLDVRQRLMLTITHDIKAPVGSIIGYADLLDKTADGKKRAAYLGNMQTSAKHLLDLVNSLLDYHRLDADKMDINTAAFNPQQLLNAVADSYRPAAAAKGLRLEYDCDSALDGYFSGDPFRIRQIVENLMSNAMKFTKEGSVAMAASLDGEQLHISVTDTGCGITKDEQERIFQKFTRLKSAQGQEGFGLGLSITQKLVALLGGTMDVSSELGKGSRFCVVLPLPKADDSNSRTSDQHPAANARFSQPWSLLLIDDDNLQLQLTEAMLRNLGAIVTICQQPQELFVKIAECHHDAVLTDIQMPAMNGFDLLRNLRSLGCDEASSIPVIAVTARSDMDGDSLRGEGFAECLHKPFRQQEIVDVVETAIASNETDTFDFSALTAFSADDADASREIMLTFAEETRKNIQRMERAIADGNLKEMAETAHKMLPLFTMIGAKRAVAPLSCLNDKRAGGDAGSADTEMAQTIVDVAKNVVNEIAKASQD